MGLAGVLAVAGVSAAGGVPAASAAVVSGAGVAAAGAGSAGSAPAAPTLDLKVLLVGGPSGDVTTSAWQAALDSEGVPYTLATASGAIGSETVTLPALSSGTTGNFNAVVIADSPAFFAAGQLDALDAYESSFGVRQVDGYMYPSPALGVTVVATSGAAGRDDGDADGGGPGGVPGAEGPGPV